MPPPKARIELPVREFLFTLDQIASLLNVSEANLASNYLFFDGVTTGSSRGRMRARDISNDPNRRDWRVGESQFMMFLRARGFTVVESRVIR